MTDLFLSGSSPQQQWSRRRTTGGDSRTQGKAGRDGEMFAGDSKGPRQFTVCLTLRRLMSYIYGAPILDVSRSHTTTQHSR